MLYYAWYTTLNICHSSLYSVMALCVRHLLSSFNLIKKINECNLMIISTLKKMCCRGTPGRTFKLSCGRKYA